MGSEEKAYNFSLRFTDRDYKGPRSPLYRIHVSTPVINEQVMLCVAIEDEEYKNSNYGPFGNEKIMYFHTNNVDGAAAFIIGNRDKIGNWGKAEMYRESDGKVLAEWDLVGDESGGSPRQCLNDDISCVKSILKSLEASVPTSIATDHWFSRAAHQSASIVSQSASFVGDMPSVITEVRLKGGSHRGPAASFATQSASFSGDNPVTRNVKSKGSHDGSVGWRSIGSCGLGSNG